MAPVSSTIKKYSMWFSLFLALACSFIIFWYTDIGDTLDNSVLLVEALLNGEFFDYYEYAALNSSPFTGYSANYNILLYVIFAIWNLPTVYLHLAIDLDYMTDPFASAWCKLIIVFALIGVFFAVRRITEKICGSYDDCNLAGFLFLSSLCVTVPALIASQYDCISLLLMLWGIIFFIDRRTVPFLAMFALAVPLKLFAVFIFLPMILLRFKNVPKLIGMLAVVIIPSYLIDLPFSGNVYFKAAMESQNHDALDLLLKSNISFGDFKINLFFAVYIVICFICYLMREDDPIREAHLAVYFSFVVFAAFCALIPIRSYWIILFTPFLAILAALKTGNRTLALIADTLAGLGAGVYFLAHHWIYNTGLIASGVAFRYHMFPEDREQKYEGFAGLLKSLGLSDIKYVFFAIFLGAIAFSLYYLYPRKAPAETDESKGKDEKSEFWVLIARPVILFSVVTTLLFCHFTTIPTMKFGEIEYNRKSKTNLMISSGESREVVFDDDYELTTMTLHLDTWAHRSARAFVGVRIVDKDTKKTVFNDAVAVVLIENDAADFDLSGLKVKKGKKYKVELYTINPELFDEATVYPYLDSEGELAVTFR